MTNTIKNSATLILICLLFFLSVIPCPAENDLLRVSVLVIDGDSCLLHQALKTACFPDHLKARYFAFQELQNNDAARKFVLASTVLIVDVMSPDLSQFCLDHSLPQMPRANEDHQFY